MLIAISYRLFSEWRKVVLAWELRYLAVCFGLIVLYVLTRIRCERLPRSDTTGRRLLLLVRRLGLAIIVGFGPAWILWSLIDPIADRYTLFEVARVATSGEISLCALGWFAWSGILGELTMCFIAKISHRFCVKPSLG